MMNNKQICNILAASHSQPTLSPRMSLGILVQIIQLVLNYPILRSIAAPQLRIPCLFLFKPCRSIALEPPRRQTLSILFSLNNFHKLKLQYHQQRRITHMNQKTLQNIYRTFQTEEFYRRYLDNLGCREDRRKIDEPRPMRATSKNNSVVLSCGQTIIIAHVEASIEQVTFSPVSNSYGQPLLKLKVSNANTNQKSKQGKGEKAIQYYIQQKVDWSHIEDQLAGSDLITGKQYAYKGNIVVRVLGDDGGVEQYSLLAVELLLLTCKFKKFVVHKEKIQQKEEEFSLYVKSIIYPIKYCEILNKILVDPSLTQAQNADFVVTVLKDLKNIEKPPTVIQLVRKIKGDNVESHLLNIMKRWESDINKVKSIFQQKLEQLKTNNECILN